MGKLALHVTARRRYVTSSDFSDDTLWLDHSKAKPASCAQFVPASLSFIALIWQMVIALIWQMVKPTATKQGIPSVAGKFPCPISGCTFSETGGADCRVEPFRTAECALRHLRQHHKAVSGQYVALSVEDFEEGQRKRKELQLEQTRRRVKACRQRNKENEAPAVLGICTVFASLLGAQTKSETISRLNEILQSFRQGRCHTTTSAKLTEAR